MDVYVCFSLFCFIQLRSRSKAIEDINGFEFTTLSKGLKLAYDAYLDKMIFENIDKIFDESPKEAESYMCKALEEANLANTMLLAKDYKAAYKYAKVAISRFKARNYLDAHYCAALSAVATCYYEWGNINKAKAIYEEAMDIVANTIGKNSQYERLKESVLMCNNNMNNQTISGMELSKRYFEEYGRSMLNEKFNKYKDKITVGLVGEGSDCYGFDDEYSMDHDFGPGFCMFIDDDVYDEIGEALAKEYDNLPKEFLGIKGSETALAGGRRGVIKSLQFYKNHLGAASYDDIDFTLAKDYELAVCTNGQIFYGDATSFIEMRNRLKEGYPDRIRLLKIAEDVASFSQTGQYNFARMLSREDDFTAGLMLSDFCKVAMVLYHHLHNVYPPHDKWLKKSTLRIEDGKALLGLLEKVTNMYKLDEAVSEVEAAINEVARFIASKLYECGDISDIDPYLASHVSELMFKASIIECDKSELVDKVVRLEFKAFDEVKNEGGRASCQNDWPTFSVMRKSQYLTFTKEMLVQYLYDFTREYERGHNLITEKYGRMMESTAPDRYEKIKNYFPQLSQQKKAIIEEIVRLQMVMADEFAKQYPNLANNARSFHTYEDNMYNTSYETYLRGEISTYSDKMLQLYAAFIVSCVQEGVNIAKETISNTACLYGYANIEEFEKSNQ